MKTNALSTQSYAINDQHFLHTFSGISALLRELHPQPMEQIFSSVAAIAQLKEPCKRLTVVLAGLMPEATATLPASENSTKRRRGPRFTPKLFGWRTK